MTQLREYLTKNGITQGEFADRLGISRTYLNEIVGGRKTPTLEIAFAIQTQTDMEVTASSWVKQTDRAAS